MKSVSVLALIALFSVISTAQSRSITKAEYDKVFQYAVTETNAAFPFVFTVTVETLVKGKVISTETMIDERQAAGVERITKTLNRDGGSRSSYQVKVGFGKVYCSSDGVSWTGPQKFECPGPDLVLMLYGPREPESTEFSVEEKSVKGEIVKLYREYSVFAPNTQNGKKEFSEKVSTIDSKGFFLKIIGTEGTLEPRDVTLTRRQSWDAKTIFKQVVAPVK